MSDHHQPHAITTTGDDTTPGSAYANWTPPDNLTAAVKEIRANIREIGRLRRECAKHRTRAVALRDELDELGTPGGAAGIRAEVMGKAAEIVVDAFLTAHARAAGAADDATTSAVVVLARGGLDVADVDLHDPDALSEINRRAALAVAQVRATVPALMPTPSTA